MTIKFFIEGIFTPLLGIFGVIGNLLSIKVLSSKDLDMMPSFRHLLKMLAGFDANFLVFTLTLFCASAWSKTYDEYYRLLLTPYMLPIIQISLTGSAWTTMAVSVERYMTVCLSYRSQFFASCNNNYHLAYTLPIMASSFIFNIPRFFELRTEMISSNCTEFNETLQINVTKECEMLSLLPTNLRRDANYSRDYVLIANSLSLVFIPILILVILNSFIFRTIRKATQRHNAISSHQRRDHSVTMMLCFIVVVFVICHSIRSIINTYEWIQLALHDEVKHWPEWVETLVHINHFALVVNSSINIVIYCWRDEKFLDIMLITLKIRNQRGGTQGGRGRRCRVVIEECISRAANSSPKNNGAEMKELINLKASRSITETTCLSDSSRIANSDSPKIVVSGGPKHLQQNHHHHHHHRHRSLQSSSQLHLQDETKSNHLVEVTVFNHCEPHHHQQQQQLESSTSDHQFKIEVSDGAQDDDESSRCSCENSSCEESQSSVSNHEDSVGLEMVPLTSTNNMIKTKVAAATQVP